MSLEDVPLKSLKEVTKYLSRGITPSYTENEGVIVLNQRCIRDNKIDWSNIRLTDPQKKKISSDKYLKQYDVLVNSTGVGTLGRSAQVKKLFSDTTVDSHVTILRPNDLVDPMFFGYAVNMVEKNIESLAEGSTGQTELSRVRLGEEIFINLPPKDIQKKIAKILSYLDEKIELNEKINKNLLKISKKIYEEWFLNYEFPNNEGKPYKTNDGKFKDTEFGTIPVDWNIGLLENIIDFQNGYSFKSGDLLKEEKPNCYAIFKMGNIIKGGGFNPSATKSWIKKSESSDLSKYLIKKGDLLMCMTDMKGNVALLGHTALMDVDNEYLLNQRVGLLRVSNDIEIDYPYLYLLTNHHIFLTNLRGRANSGVQVNLSTKEIKHSKIIIPPKIVNQKFNKVVKPIFDIIFNNNIEIQKLTKTRDTLLPKLMSGEIDVSKINYDLE